VLNDGREANPVWDLESAHERPFVQKAGEARGGGQRVVIKVRSETGESAESEEEREAGWQA
jgi:hypothetical protein